VLKPAFQPKRGGSRFARLVVGAEHNDKVTGLRVRKGVRDQTGRIVNVVNQGEMDVQFRLDVAKVGKVIKSRSLAYNDVDRFPTGGAYDQVASDPSDYFACDFHSYLHAHSDHRKKRERDAYRFFPIGRTASVTKRTSVFRSLTYEQSIARRIDCDNALLAACD
jgi:hypothetical protein